jgi:hypothetical protein
LNVRLFVTPDGLALAEAAAAAALSFEMDVAVFDETLADMSWFLVSD